MIEQLLGLRMGSVGLEEVGMTFSEFQKIARSCGVRVHRGGSALLGTGNEYSWREETFYFRPEDTRTIVQIAEDLGIHAVDVWPGKNLIQARAELQGIDLSPSAQDRLIKNLIKQGLLR